MVLSDVSNILWRERQLLELLVFKLEEEQLVLAAGRSRWLAYAAREVAKVRGETKGVGLERAVLVAGAGRDLGLSGSPTLRELAGRTSSPWDGIFAGHRHALLTLAQEIDAIASSNDEIAPGQRVRTARISQFPPVQTVQSQSTADGLTMRQSLSIVEDTHLAQVKVAPQSGRVASQVTHLARARAVQPSLADFLK
ncbi:MAG TPA: flagellar export chaperone FlgN [Acidimicrobiia bacterium]